MRVIDGNYAFIHSLFRSGSTYFLHVFRRSVFKYWCYQEPFHESLSQMADAPEFCLEDPLSKNSQLRHPSLSLPYFYEFYQVKDSMEGLFKASFSYESFFYSGDTSSANDVCEYIGALIKNSPNKPILQFCRSYGRVKLLKDSFGGAHVHLWREPRNQWWSYKVDGYFDSVNLLIYQAKNLPPVLGCVKNRFLGSMANYGSVGGKGTKSLGTLSVPTNYALFYGLWLYSFIELDCVCDVAINIERFSYDVEYKKLAVSALDNLGLKDLDFSDCKIPFFEMSSEEGKFFSEIELSVKDIFLEAGYSDELLNYVELEIVKVNQLAMLDRKANGREIALQIMVNNIDSIQAVEGALARAEARLKVMESTISWRSTKLLRVLASYSKVRKF